MNTKILAVLALVGASSISTATLAESEIFGRPEAAVQSEIEKQGYDVDRIEEWSGYVLAFVRNADGGTTIELFDASSYEHVG